MKKVGDLMKELGFRPEGSDGVKKAFVKNLIEQAKVSEISRQSAKKSNQPKESTADIDGFRQLSLFDTDKIPS